MFCKKYDVAVCGGGIAGCAAAIDSAKRSMKTCLCVTAKAVRSFPDSPKGS